MLLSYIVPIPVNCKKKKCQRDNNFILKCKTHHDSLVFRLQANTKRKQSSYIALTTSAI